ncbi:MAG: galactokinase, partial [Armatimonadetes bacterium]|nr:galactokinase [Armatimonadota bacterium]
MNNLSKGFKKIFSQKPEFLVKAPGRVNLIGEHTDYNGGFVLPIAINKFIFMAASKRKDNLLSIYSLNYNQKFETSLNKIAFSKNNIWANYLQGVAKILQSKKFKLKGANILFSGNIPQGSGLSSSAALEVAAILAFQKINRFKLDKLSLVLICQEAENK